MKKVKYWSARRAGNTITVDGRDVETGDVVKITGIDRIIPGTYRESRSTWWGGVRHINVPCVYAVVPAAAAKPGRTVILVCG